VIDWLLVTRLALASVYLAAIPLVLAGHRTRASGLLAAFFALSGINQLLRAAYPYETDRAWDYTFAVFTQSVTFVALYVYVLFIGWAVKSSMTMPLRRLAPAVLVAVPFLALAVAYVLAPTLFIGRELGRLSTGGWDWDVTPLTAAIDVVVPVVLLFAPASAWLAIKQSDRGSLDRARAKRYLGAFAVFDIALILPSGALGGLFETVVPETRFLIVVGLARIAAVMIIVASVLRYQLFDYELKLKWTLERGTLVAVILFAFVVTTAIAEQFLQGYGFLVGGLAIGCLLFALRPIERAIDRMADRAMPKTTGTPEYLALRKHEIYRAAIEDMAADGAITVKERSALLRLAKNLGLDGNDAMRIESEVLDGGNTS
jgi:hypothetical protein